MASVAGAKSPGYKSDNESKVQCDRCDGEGVVTDATKFCAQCEEYMCTSCTIVHGSFKQLRCHKLTSVGDLSRVEESDAGKLSPSYCDVHEDKFQDLYCKKHDAIICDSCKLTKHRKCEVVFVHDMPQAATCGKQLVAALDAMVELKARIESLLNERENDIEALNNIQKSCVAEIQHFKTTLIELVERLEKEMLDNIKNVVATEMGALQEHVATCELLLPEVNTAIKNAHDAKSVDDVLTSVIVEQKTRTSLPVLEEVVADIEQEAYGVKITVSPSPTLSDLVTHVDRLGTLIVSPAIALSLSAWPACTTHTITDMQVDSPTNISAQSSSISGSAILSDGQIILLEYNDNKVLYLDKMLSIKSVLNVTGKPWDVAVDGDTDVIVSIPESKTLQWIHVDTQLQVGRTITTNTQCYGVVVYHNTIYVSVSNIDSIGALIQVLDKSGTVIRCIGMDTDGVGMYEWPSEIAVSVRGHIYVSDRIQDRITCFTNAGEIVYDVKHKNLSVPCGMLVDKDETLLVCCRQSNDIHVLKKDGTHHKVFLSSANGLVNPLSMAYRQTDNMLIVTMANTPSCLAFPLK